MRYVMFRRSGEAHLGVLLGDEVLEVAALLQALGVPPDPPVAHSLREFIARGPALWARVEQAVAADPGGAAGEVPRHALAEVELQAPLRDTRKLIMLAGNYREHIAEAGFRVPQRSDQVTPQFFMKPPSTTVVGPGEPVLLGRASQWVDWEVELAVVIGRRCHYLPEAEAMGAVFGYTILNDISERQLHADLLERSLRERDPFFDWLNGKWCDTFAPMGPFVATAAEIADPGDLALELKHNSTTQQRARTSQMIHPIPSLISRLSQLMTLEPGDVLSTGTPSGTGFAQGIRLADGDVLECTIEGLGTLRNPVQAERSL